MDASAIDRELATSRRIHASRDKVWSALTDTQALAAWWGPSGFTNTFTVCSTTPQQLLAIRRCPVAGGSGGEAHRTKANSPAEPTMNLLVPASPGCDLRSGGEWTFTMHGPDGRSYPNLCRFAELQAPQRWVVEHLSLPRFQLAVVLTEHGAETGVHWRQTFATADDCAALRASEQAESRSSGCRRGETAALIGDIPEQR